MQARINRNIFIALTISIQLLSQPLLAGPGGFGELTPPVTELSTASVKRLIKVIPEVAKETVGQQYQFMGNMASTSSGQPQMSPEQLEALNTIYKKYGFTMEEFVMQISALMATYFILDPQAFERVLPSKDNVVIQAMLKDPKTTAKERERVLAQIEYVQKNKHLFRAQFESTTNEANKKVVKGMLPAVRKAFKAAEKIAVEGATKAKKLK